MDKLVQKIRKIPSSTYWKIFIVCIALIIIFSIIYVNNSSIVTYDIGYRLITPNTYEYITYTFSKDGSYKQYYSDSLVNIGIYEIQANEIILYEFVTSGSQVILRKTATFIKNNNKANTLYLKDDAEYYLLCHNNDQAITRGVCVFFLVVSVLATLALIILKCIDFLAYDDDILVENTQPKEPPKNDNKDK